MKIQEICAHLGEEFLCYYKFTDNETRILFSWEDQSCPYINLEALKKIPLVTSLAFNVSLIHKNGYLCMKFITSFYYNTIKTPSSHFYTKYKFSIDDPTPDELKNIPTMINAIRDIATAGKSLYCIIDDINDLLSSNNRIKYSAEIESRISGIYNKSEPSDIRSTLDSLHQQLE